LFLKAFVQTGQWVAVFISGMAGRFKIVWIENTSQNLLITTDLKQCDA
jgi:hypothetical protein